jgi:hypothetical protein
MKTRALLILGFLVFSLTAVNAQKIPENKVPQDVVISFKYKYPDAQVSSWEKSKDIYIAKFKLNDQDGKAEFTDKGVWNLTRYAINERELPTPVFNYYKTNYRSDDFTIAVSEMDKDNTGSTFYYVSVKKPGYNQNKPVELTFDLTGTLLSNSDPAQNKAGNDNKTENESKSVKESKTVKDSKSGKDNKSGNDNKTVNDNKDGSDNKEGNDNKTVTDSKDGNEKIDKKDKKDIKQDNPVVNNVPVDTTSKYIVDIAKVPAAIKTHFASKVKKASGSVWYYQNKIYTVKFNQAGKNGQSTYSKEGTWLETRLEQTPESLHQLIVAYLKDNYRTFKIKTVELVSQTKDKTIFIRMFDKRSKEMPPPLTEIMFTTTGKFINVNKPDVVDENDINNKKRMEDKNNKFLSEVDNKGEAYDNSSNYNDKVSVKEMPTPVAAYLRINYRDADMKSSRLVSDDSLGNVYVIVMRPQDTKYSVHIYFDLQGNFIKKIDEAEGKMIKASDKTIEGNHLSEKSASKYGTPDEIIKASEVPAIVLKYVKKTYPDHAITESFFKSDDEFGNCFLLILKKPGEGKVIKIYFDMEGNVLKNETEN